MECPSCDDAKLLKADRNGIEIDYCPKCRGLWLDRGELDKIIKRSHTEPTTGHSSEPKKHKRNLITELFDF